MLARHAVADRIDDDLALLLVEYGLPGGSGRGRGGTFTGSRAPVETMEGVDAQWTRCASSGPAE